MRSAANTIVYEFRTHDSVEGLTLEKSARIDGKATNRIVVSRSTANTARLVEASTADGLWEPRTPDELRSPIAGVTGPLR